MKQNLMYFSKTFERITAIILARILQVLTLKLIFEEPVMDFMKSQY